MNAQDQLAVGMRVRVISGETTGLEFVVDRLSDVFAYSRFGSSWSRADLEPVTGEYTIETHLYIAPHPSRVLKSTTVHATSTRLEQTVEAPSLTDAMTRALNAALTTWQTQTEFADRFSVVVHPQGGRPLWEVEISQA